MAFNVPNHWRVRRGVLASDDGDGNNGVFFLPNNVKGIKGRQRDRPLKVIASDGGGWEHVSVSLPDRCPSWQEMDYVKGVFWGADDCVMQLHPPRVDWVNNHRYCLHLWRPQEQEIPRPPAWMVGMVDVGELPLVPA